METRNIREIEQVIDRAQEDKEIWKIDRELLLYNALVAFEDINRFGSMIEFFTGGNLGAFISNNCDAIDMLIRWIYMYSSSINKEFIPKILPDLYIEMGMLLKQDTISYRSICDSYILWSRGKASAKLYNDGKGVEFSYLQDNRNRIEIYDLMRSNNKKNSYINNGIEDFDIDLINKIEAIDIYIEDNKLKYDIDEKIWGQIYKICKEIVDSNSELPEIWDFNGFTLGDYKKVWAALLSQSFIHYIKCIKSGITGMAVEYCVVLKTKDELINFIQKLVSVEYEVIRNIINLITYSQEYYDKKIDLIWSPIVPVKDDSIAISPSLIMYSNPERNIISLINKVKQSTYSRLSSSKEEIMVTEFINEVSKYPNIKVESNRPLPGNLPDVDIVMFDKSTETLLVCELKWLLETDSIQEVLERDKDIEKGKVQCGKIYNYITENIDDVLNRFYGKQQYNPKKIYSCVVTRNNIGTSKLSDDIKVIDEKKLYELIGKFNGNLNIVTEIIDNEKYFEGVEKHFKTFKHEVSYGGYKFKFDVFDMNIDNGYINNQTRKTINKDNNKKKKKQKISKASRRKNRK